MKTREYKVLFNNPAFLGNAHQDGQWRTSPFKALLRQWWRLAYAAGRHQEPGLVDAMRKEEGRLFGVAADGREESRKSLVRIRLDRWDIGKLSSWAPLRKVSHPETKFPVGSDLYLGYGPVTLPKGAGVPKLKANAAIQAGEWALLSLAFPDAVEAQLGQALWLLNRYGTLGGRSRNGWGSFELVEGTPALDSPLAPGLVRSCTECLRLDWPHAIGRDKSGPLIWKTSPHGDWKMLMAKLAEIKIGLRTQFKFTTGQNAPAPEDRHWLSYPITNHSVRSWDRNARLPNSLRFKVRSGGDGRVHGVIFHVPCSPPAGFQPDPLAIASVWQQVHRYLDNPARSLTRIAE
jgi:CRISPR-associated protein Cmr1